MAPTRPYNRCCNPFKLKNHVKRKSLRKASLKLREMSKLQPNDYYCSQCRTKMSNSEPMDLADIIAAPVENVSTPSDTDSSQPCSQQSQLSVDVTLPIVNEALQLLGVSPIAQKKIKCSTTVVNKKVDEVCHNLKQSLGNSDASSSSSTRLTETDSKDFLHVIYKLKAKLHDERTSKAEKIQILTLMPSNWSRSKIMDMMDVSKNLVIQAKTLLDKEGILSIPGKTMGRPITKNTKEIVTNFYKDDEVSVNMPGMKDYVSIRDDEGQRVHIQKRLILSNLKELYKFFQLQYPDVRIGFSSFAALRPKNCVLAGASGTHTVCVCSMHQNVKLMISGCDLKKLTSHLGHPLENYNDCQNLMICNDPSEACYFTNCKDCPGSEILRDLVLDVLEDNNIEELTYKQWVSKPRTTLETFVKCTTEFVDEFCTNMQVLLLHSFIAKQQASFLKQLKVSIRPDEFIIICDFAENYAFVIQDAAPGYHWNNDQSTVFPVVIYYKTNDIILHKSLVIISDCMTHDAVAVHAYFKIINEFIKTITEQPARLYYFSDGAPQQFKNFKNFINVYYHQEDFGVPAEWHFFATAHGKGPCDGIGGTVKRLAARASLQLPPDRQITDSQELYKWASNKSNLPNISTRFWPKEQYEVVEAMLATRFAKANRITGTQKLHCLIPAAHATFVVKNFSNSGYHKTYKCFKSAPK